MVVGVVGVRVVDVVVGGGGGGGGGGVLGWLGGGVVGIGVGVEKISSSSRKH